MAETFDCVAAILRCHRPEETADGFACEELGSEAGCDGACAPPDLPPPDCRLARHDPGAALPDMAEVLGA